ncbi:BPSL0761 family protein [Paraburkholderia metrosideri]|uniref:BPSL0761 family protein n=1 Tax=Paraburkholderia metrosideri TaxID=580937 RepID=UPI002E2AC053|nr:BPSL0761 family protein [Paraburkholderia metrosideri]
MDEILRIIFQNLPLLYVPAVGALVALVVLCIKRRYVKEGYIFRRPSASSQQNQAPVLEVTNTFSVSQVAPERPMTTPSERTNAVIETRRFLQELASDDGHTEASEIRESARRLLRHYPLDIDISISASAFPSVWSEPEA